MADLVTHIAVGHLLKRTSRRPEHPLIFALGACLPDLLGRVPGLLAAGLDNLIGIELAPYFAFGVDALHTPIPYTLCCLFFAYLVQEPQRRMVFWNLTLGGFTHFAVDLPQTHIAGGYRLLFPFSWFELELQWFSTEASLKVAPWLALAALGVELWFQRRARVKRG